MKTFTVDFVKTLYVRGTKTFQAETAEEAAGKADAALHDTVNPLQTTDIRWGDPQYEEGSLELDDSDPEELPGYGFVKNSRGRFDIPFGTIFDKIKVNGLPGHTFQVSTPEGLGCGLCAAEAFHFCYLVECRGSMRADGKDVHYLHMPPDTKADIENKGTPSPQNGAIQ